MHTTYQRADCQKVKVHPGVQRDPVETKQRRVRRGPCWPFPLSKSSAQHLVWMRRWLKRLGRCWAVTHCGKEDRKHKIIRCVYIEKEQLKEEQEWCGVWHEIVWQIMLLGRH